MSSYPTWAELRRQIDQALEDKGLTPEEVEFWYFDQQAVLSGRYEIHIGQPHHDGTYEIWID